MKNNPFVSDKAFYIYKLIDSCKNETQLDSMTKFLNSIQLEHQLPDEECASLFLVVNYKRKALQSIK